MPRRSQVVAQVVRYGVRYAPLAYEGFKRTRRALDQNRHETVSGTVIGSHTAPLALPSRPSRRLTRRAARAAALEHAAHLVDGSALPVYDGDIRVWVVFSGDTVVGTHPVVSTPPEQLIAHYDLSTRVRPPRVPHDGSGSQS